MKFLVPSWTDLEELGGIAGEVETKSVVENQQKTTEFAEFYEMSLNAVQDNLEREYLRQPKGLWSESGQMFLHERVDYAERIAGGLLNSLTEFRGCSVNEELQERACDSVMEVYQQARRSALLKSALQDASSNELHTRQIEALHNIKDISPQERNRLTRTAWLGVVYSLESKEASRTEDFTKILDAVAIADINPIRSQLKAAVAGLISMDRGRELLPHDFESIKSVTDIIRTSNDAKEYEADLSIHRAIVTNIAERYIDSVNSGEQRQVNQYKKLIEALGVELDIDPENLPQNMPHQEVGDLTPEEVLDQINALPNKSSRVKVEYDPVTNRAKVVSRAVGAGLAASAILASQLNPAAAATSKVSEVAKIPTFGISVALGSPTQAIETTPNQAPKIITIDVKPIIAKKLGIVAPSALVTPNSINPPVVDFDVSSVTRGDVQPVAIESVDSTLENVDDLISFYLQNNSSAEAYQLISQKVEQLYNVEAVSFPGFQNKLTDFINNLDQEAASKQLTSEQQFDYTFRTLYAQLLAEYPALLSQMNINDLIKGNEQFAAIVAAKWLDQEHGFGDEAGENYTSEQRIAIEQVLASAMARLLSDSDKVTLLTQLDPSYVPPVAPVEVTPHTQTAPKQHHHKPKHQKHHAQATPEHGQAHNKYNSGNYKELWHFFANDSDLGLSEVGTAALLGNFATETGGTMNPQIIQGFDYSKVLPHHILGKLGYGLNQATSIDRQRHMMAVAKRMGLPEGTLRVQQQYIKEELLNYPDLLDLLRRDNPDLLERSAIQVEVQYERAGVNAWDSRTTYAKRIYAANGSGHHKVDVPKHDDGDVNGIPDDHGDRASYFVDSLGLEKGSVNLTKSLAGIFHFVLGENIASRELGIRDVYPDALKNIAKDSIADKYGMLNRECVSYVAYRVGTDKFDSIMPHWGGRDNRPGVPGVQSGNANDWDENARGAGIKVNDKPHVGSVMQWNSNGAEHSFAGHVAYVEKVNDDGSLVISQYNAGGTGDFSVEIISPQLLNLQKNQVNFIHFEEWNS
jgi:surface antigen